VQSEARIDKALEDYAKEALELNSKVERRDIEYADLDNLGVAGAVAKLAGFMKSYQHLIHFVQDASAKRDLDVSKDKLRAQVLSELGSMPPQLPPAAAVAGSASAP